MEKTIETALLSLFEGCGEDAVETFERYLSAESLSVRARTYEDAGVMTTDAGVVLRVTSADCDSEFQITIVRSR